MGPTPRALAVLALAWPLAVPASASVELVPGFTVQGDWDSNVFGSFNNEEADFSARLGPDLTLRRQQGDLTFDVGYRGRFETFARLDGLETFDHLAHAIADWRITPRTRAGTRIDFSRVHSTATRFLEVDTPTPDPGASELIEFERDPIDRLLARFDLSHALSPRWTLAGQGDAAIYEFDDPTRFDTTSFQGSAQLVRAWSPRTQIGLGAAAIHQTFESPQSGEGQKSSFFQGFGFFAHEFSPTLRTVMRGGPTYTIPEEGASSVDTLQFPVVGLGIDNLALLVDADTCPTFSDGTPFFDPRGSRCSVIDSVVVDANSVSQVSVPRADTEVDNSLSFFGSFEISKDWTATTARLLYQRTASNSGGLGASTVIDAVVGSVIWKPSPRWYLHLVGTWDTRRSSSDIPLQVFALQPTDVEVDPLTGELLPPGSGGTPVSGAGETFELRTIDTTSDAIDITQWRAEVRTNYRWSRHLTLFSSALYRRQDSEGELQTGTQIEEVRIFVGFSWEFAPIQF